MSGAKRANHVKKPVRRLLPWLILIVGLPIVGKGDWSAWDLDTASTASLAILLTAAVLWVSEAVPLFVTSFIILAMSIVWLMPVMQEAGTKVTATTFLSPFFSNIILLFLGGFTLAAGFTKYRLDEQCARWVIRKTGGSVPMFIGGIMCVTAFLSMWLSNTATAAMMMALCIPVTQRLPAGDPYRRAILLAIPFSANVGGIGTPIGTPPNAIAIRYMEQLHIAPSFLTWMLLGVPAVLVLLTAVWAMLMIFYRGKTTRITIEESVVLKKGSPAGKFIVVIAVITVAGWLSGELHHLSSGTVALLPVILLFGTRVLDVNDLRTLSWDVLVLMGGGLCLGVGIEQSGLAGVLITHLPTEGLSMLGLVLLFAGLACGMSMVMSNTAAATLVMPLVCGLSGVSSAPLLLAVAFACSVAMALPISTPPNAIAFGSGQLKVSDMIKPGLAITLLGLGLICTVFIRFWEYVGIY